MGANGCPEGAGPRNRHDRHPDSQSCGDNYWGFDAVPRGHPNVINAIGQQCTALHHYYIQSERPSGAPNLPPTEEGSRLGLIDSH